MKKNVIHLIPYWKLCCWPSSSHPSGFTSSLFANHRLLTCEQVKVCSPPNPILQQVYEYIWQQFYKCLSAVFSESTPQRWKYELREFWAGRFSFNSGRHFSPTEVFAALREIRAKMAEVLNYVMLLANTCGIQSILLVNKVAECDNCKSTKNEHGKPHVASVSYHLQVNGTLQTVIWVREVHCKEQCKTCNSQLSRGIFCSFSGVIMLYLARSDDASK